MISAYRIGDHVYLIATDKPADPEPPNLLPIGSPRLDAKEAMEFAMQLLKVCATFVIPADEVDRIFDREAAK